MRAAGAGRATGFRLREPHHRDQREEQQRGHVEHVGHRHRVGLLVDQAVHARGSLRRAGEAVRNFAPGEVGFTPGRVWESAGSRARYPVEWTIATPAGRFTVAALLDNQELDSRGSSGAIYWEGLSDLRDESGRRVGRGYLEMTGYAAALRL